MGTIGRSKKRVMTASLPSYYGLIWFPLASCGRQISIQLYLVAGGPRINIDSNSTRRRPTQKTIGNRRSPHPLWNGDRLSWLPLNTAMIARECYFAGKGDHLK